MNWESLRLSIIAAICEHANELKRLRKLRRTIEKIHSEVVTGLASSELQVTDNPSEGKSHD